MANHRAGPSLPDKRSLVRRPIDAQRRCLRAGAIAACATLQNFTLWKKVLDRKNPGLRSTTTFLMMEDSVSHHEIISAR
ncbi:hypothetical protein CBM2615_A240158 [Cupriavidus taiwanensis]|uniref:Uncharacterized protein n=1 Tax=Cupriavidus taiwanensis TaxID=164546 RepID=A0A375DYF1_9BURK|nr:hypothetical protein CBM2615_A240158 [Cupriavidus taiwanensis]SOZ53905.1 hypothetical protein CBM2614_A210159 [Cupriavidus taiwanensis]SOZ56438.1 hypothetical protein CBM2613_A220157 [Cupriavidus taiwanensis]SPA04719.1 hypothetical protein CBM2625_A170156 [Cupriavidus taiwanensis]